MDDLKIYLQQHYRGKENAVKSNILESQFGCKGADIRRMVNDLRCQGVPICSGRTGYYYAADKNEVASTVANLNGRIDKIQAAKTGLLNAIREKTYDCKTR